MEIVATITSTIVSMVSIIPIVKDKIFSIKRMRKYYKKLIVPYVNEQIRNKDIKTCEFIKNRYKRTNENIPKYVTYLIDNNDNDRLNKVLLYDYCFIYKNERNNTLNFFNNFMGILKFILNLSTVIILVFSGLSFAMFLYLSGEALINLFNKNLLDIRNPIPYLILFIFLFFLSLLMFKWNLKLSLDVYSLKLDDIKKNINDRIDWYDKQYNKRFI